ncbi:MAG TPA: tetratricopeptide repeat protein, partial [Candidatus Sulfotelmatobacter sp.]|nr:tetratricopeptide repeat protein [Candidatus Sulfotelmatobacter sp.]
QWQAAYDAGVASQSQGNLAEARTAYERAARIDDEFAALAYRRAECCRRLGQEVEAAKLFRQARDLDALQFRADGPINERIRRSAAAFSDRRVSLVDAEGIMATNSPQGLSGAEYFYEHVHLTPEGNYLLARAVAEQTVKVLALEPAGDWLSQADCLRLAGLTDLNRSEALEIILDRIQGAPFTNQVDYAQALQRVNEQLARYRGAAKPAQVRRDLQQISKLITRYPADPDLRWNLATLLESAGDLAGSETQWRTLMAMQPQAALPAINLGKLLDRVGRLDEAYALYSAGLRINPEYHPARHALGVLCLRLNRVPEAIQHLNLVVQQKPQAIEPQLALGQALARAHRTAEAESHLREVLRLDPNNAAAQAQLRELSGK